MPGGAVRSLTVAIGVQDRATKIVGALKKDLNKIDGTVSKAELAAKDSASKAIKAVTKSLEASDKAAAQAFKSFQRFEGGASQAERGVSRLSTALKKAGGAIDTYSKKIDAAKKKTESLESLQGPAAGVAAMSGGILAFSMMTSAQIDKNMAAAMNSAKNAQEASLYEQFVKSGGAGNQAMRAIAARKGSVGLQGISEISAQQNLEFLELVIAEAQKTGANENEIESAVEGFYTGSVDTINDILGGFGISNDTINARIEQMRKENPEKWGADPKAAGARTDEEMMTIVGMELYTDMLRERRAEAQKTGETELDAATRLSNAMTDFRANIGRTMTPVIEIMAKGATIAAKFTEKFPRAAVVMAVGLALAFLASTLVLFVGMAAPGIIALHGIAAGMSLGAVATGAMSAAMGVLNAVMAMNPIFLVAAALVGIAAILVYVNKKTGILTKAWGELNELWSSLKEGDVGKIGKKAATMAFKLVFPPAMLYAILKHVPGMANIMDRVEVKIGGILSHLIDFKDQAVDSLKNLIPGWLKNIWDRLNDIVIRIKEALITALGGLIPDEVKTSLEAIAAVKEGQAAGVGARAASVRSWGIQRKSDDGYKVAQFTPAEGLSMNQMARAASLMGDRGYLTWPELMALSAEDQALFGWGGSTTEMTRNQMLKAGWSESNLEAYDKFLGRVGGDRADAEDVAGANTDYTKTNAGEDLLGGLPEKVDDVLTEAVTENSTINNIGTKIDEATKDKGWVSVNWNSDTPWINKDTGVAITDREYGSTTEGRGRYFNAKYVTDEDLASYGWRRTADGFEKLASGGGILSTGLVVGHEDEEFSPADVVHRTTAAERLLGRLESTGILPSAGSSRLGDTINVTVNVTVNGVKESFSKFDLARLISQQVKRELGQFKT